MYNKLSSKAEEFIDHQEILDSIGGRMAIGESFGIVKIVN